MSVSAAIAGRRGLSSSGSSRSGSITGRPGSGETSLPRDRGLEAERQAPPPPAFDPSRGSAPMTTGGVTTNIIEF